MYVDVSEDIFNESEGFKTPYPSANGCIRVHNMRMRLYDKHGLAFIITDVLVQYTDPYTLTPMAWNPCMRMRVYSEECANTTHGSVQTFDVCVGFKAM